jgi:hypothetical protein
MKAIIAESEEEKNETEKAVMGEWKTMSSRGVTWLEREKISVGTLGKERNATNDK